MQLAPELPLLEEPHDNKIIIEINLGATRDNPDLSGPKDEDWQNPNVRLVTSSPA
jgi:hypothetical protein